MIAAGAIRGEPRKCPDPGAVEPGRQSESRIGGRQDDEIAAVEGDLAHAGRAHQRSGDQLARKVRPDDTVGRSGGACPE